MTHMQHKNNTHHPPETLPDFDPHEILPQMTDGFRKWHHVQKERLLTLRLCSTTVACFVCLAIAAANLAPKEPYLIAEGTTHTQVVRYTNNLLHS